jgi:hypothetical protein
MLRTRLRSSMLIALLVVIPSVDAVAQSPADTGAVELAAARFMLRLHPAERVHLDSVFAVPRSAPGVRTTLSRPHGRNLYLADSLKAVISSDRPLRGSYQILSDPVFDGDSASVSVTVDYPIAPTASGRARRFYETLEMFLRRRDGAWTVVRTVSLGIS